MGHKFDEILKQLGTGRWNLLYFAAIGHGFFVIVPFVFVGPFVSPPLDHTCKEPFLPPNSISQEATLAFNRTNNDPCVVEFRTDEGQLESTKCTLWDYDNSTFTSTITAEYDLVCEQAFQRIIFQSSQSFGNLFGDPLSGFLQDKYGRRFPASASVILFLVVTMAISWVPSLNIIIALRFVTGMMTPIIISGFFTMALEVCEPKYRSIIGIITAMPFALGVIAWGGLAYFIRDWRWLLFVASLPSILFFPILMVMDESPRWLIVQGRFDDAVKVLEKAARWNGVRLPPREVLTDQMREIATEESGNEKKPTNDGKDVCHSRIISVLDAVTVLFRTPEMRKITLIMCLSFVTVMCVYLGLSIAGMIFKVDAFLYMVLTGVMEIPAYTVTIPIIAKFGRKNPSIIGYWICAVSVLGLPFVPEGMGWLTITLAMTGKLFVSAVFQILFLYSMELFPTEVRVRGFGISLVASRIGLMLTPYIIDTLGNKYYWLPSLIFGILGVVTALATMLLPDTLDRPLYETVHALEYDRKMRDQRSDSTVKAGEIQHLT